MTGWQLLALRAAQDAGLAVPKKNIEQAVLYVKRCAHPSGGFSYMPGTEPNIARTGTGVLSLEICGDFRSPEALRGGDWLLTTPSSGRGPSSTTRPTTRRRPCTSSAGTLGSVAPGKPGRPPRAPEGGRKLARAPQRDPRAPGRPRVHDGDGGPEPDRGVQVPADLPAVAIWRRRAQGPLAGTEQLLGLPRNAA